MSRLKNKEIQTLISCTYFENILYSYIFEQKLRLNVSFKPLLRKLL